MEYMSLTPISLALEDKAVIAGAMEDSSNADERKEQESKMKLVEKLKLHSVTRPQSTEKEQSLRRIIDQINCSQEMERLLKENVDLLVSRRLRRALSVSERAVQSAKSAWRTAMNAGTETIKFLWPFVTRTFISMLLFWRFVADTILNVLEWRLRPELAALKDISATGLCAQMPCNHAQMTYYAMQLAQQFDIRLQQFCYWPLQYVTLRKRKEDWDSVTTSHPDYIRFYNSLWLVANDIIIGIALGSYIIENSSTVAFSIDYYLRVGHSTKY
jgi:phosphatidylinositol glycan class Q protein